MALAAARPEDFLLTEVVGAGGKIFEREIRIIGP
jgi:hypothetical protein